MLYVIMPSVVMLSVVAPTDQIINEMPILKVLIFLKKNYLF
jgi:hypothetical protein